MNEAPFGNTLIVGAGPAAIQTAVLFARSGMCGMIGMANRAGERSDKLKEWLDESGGSIKAAAQHDRHKPLEGEVKLDRFIVGLDQVLDDWQTIVCCTPSDTYAEVIESINVNGRIRVKTVILLSPSIGSAYLVRGLLNDDARGRVDIVSCSTYYAATKFASNQEQFPAAVVTKAVKKRIYAASFRNDSAAARHLQRLLENVGIACTRMGHVLDAECRNITTYVHPPFFMNADAIDMVFGRASAKKYMYKLYPEGPITPLSIRIMLELWKEVSALMRKVGAEPVNLLQFMNDDNYPVLEQSLSRDDIERFPHADPIGQQYLLYIRYASLLVDPYSIPDGEGRYYDFSAVPFRPVHRNSSGRWVIPRIPYEDYRKLKLLVGLAGRMNVSMPRASQLAASFETALREFAAEHGENPAQWVVSASSDADAVCAEMGRGV